MTSRPVQPCGLAAALAVALLALANVALAADFGEVELVSGQVTVQTQDGRVLIPRAGDRIPAGAEMATGKDGELHINTADSGYVALRPNTRLRVAEYRAEGDELDTQILSLVRGTFRSVTGWIGKHNPDRYKVTTPTATIGVRGTDHEPSYLWQEDVDQAGDDDAREPGTYDKVNEGASFIENESGRIEIAAKQAGFAPKTRGKPARLKRIPRFFKGTPHEKRIGEKRELLRKVMEKRRAEKRAKLKDRLDRIQDRREHRERRRD